MPKYHTTFFTLEYYAFTWSVCLATFTNERGQLTMHTLKFKLKNYKSWGLTIELMVSTNV